MRDEAIGYGTIIQRSLIDHAVNAEAQSVD
ncbi:hypothetical protein JOD20_005041 [Herpetosiphon giganteus]|nr:hypothetical protein [Herpetosiphon giganteus]